MWGAIIGDLAGSIYEYNQVKQLKAIKVDEIIPKNAFFSDDTILTVAIAEAIQKGGNYETFLKKYGKLYENYKPNIKPYFKTSFSPGFIKWCNGEKEGTSIGNGAMMRVAPVGFLFKNERDVKLNARLATMPSHNSKEAVVYATLIALIIFYAKQQIPKEDILKRLNLNLNFKPFEIFNTTCSQTFDNCVYAAFNSNSFEESIKKVLSFGGDTDTNACIVGGMAEALYGVDKELIKLAKGIIPGNFIKIIDQMYKNREVFER